MNSITFHLAFEYFQGDDQTDKIELQLEQLRLSSVEREFRKRIAEYNGGKSINGAGDSGSVRYYYYVEININRFLKNFSKF